jgi:hypothetical protein
MFKYYDCLFMAETKSFQLRPDQDICNCDYTSAELAHDT